MEYSTTVVRFDCSVVQRGRVHACMVGTWGPGTEVHRHTKHRRPGYAKLRLVHIEFQGREQSRAEASDTTGVDRRPVDSFLQHQN